MPLFECCVTGCVGAFETFGELEQHLDLRKQIVNKVNQYDKTRRDWALKFSSVEAADTKSCQILRERPSPLSGEIAAISILKNRMGIEEAEKQHNIFTEG